MSHFNISTLSPVDILKLLRQVLPSVWFWDSTTVVQRPTNISDQWLRDLWSYIIQSKASDIFEGSIPLLPVFVADGDGSCQLLKLKEGVPMLHMMFRENMPSLVMDCLDRLGFTSTILRCLVGCLFHRRSRGCCALLPIEGLLRHWQRWVTKQFSCRRRTNGRSK